MMNRNTSLHLCPGTYGLVRYLLLKLAPVLLGIKPAGLLRLTSCRFPALAKRHELFCLHQPEILALLRLDCRILKQNNANLVVLFFREENLSRALEDPETAAFLAEYGYQSGAELPELQRRCRENRDFPHEIGAFLGYPLKDVIGFIENPTECLALPRGMWRVAGDPEASQEIMERFRSAETMVRDLMEHPAPLEEILQEIHNLIPAA